MIIMFTMKVIIVVWMNGFIMKKFNLPMNRFLKTKKKLKIYTLIQVNFRKMKDLMNNQLQNI